jgi:hypothetical protein
MTLISQVEEVFGRIERGWSFQSGAHTYKVVECLDGRLKGVNTYCTIGVSHAVLQLGQGRYISQEVLISLDDSFIPNNIAALVSQVSDQILDKHAPLKDSEIIRRSGPIFEGKSFTAFWVKSPIFFGDDAGGYKGDEVGGGVCIFAWLIPLFESEARFVELNGGGAFEDILVDNEVDFFLSSDRLLYKTSKYILLL